MSDLGSLIQSIYSNKNESKFPFYLILTDKPSRGHTFVIEESGLDYMRYLYGSLYSITAKHNISIDWTLTRSLYFLTEFQQRRPKCIFNGENVRSVFIHYPKDVFPSTWYFKPSALDGHVLPHFRNDNSPFYKGKLNSSIANLRIDFEYLYFIIKKFSDFC